VARVVAPVFYLEWLELLVGAVVGTVI